MGIRLANIIDFDISDSCDGVSISLWTAGCPHKCPGCHNSRLWDGSDFPVISKEEILNALKVLDISDTARSESLTNKQIIDLANILTK